MPRQVSFDRYGGADVLQLVDAEKPVPAEGQLLVGVRAAGINPFDAKLRSGLYEDMIPVQFPSLQGTDVAGVIEAVGPGVTEFRPGDEIIGSTGRRGAQADYALVPAATALPRPSTVSWEVGGGLWVVGTTAQAAVDAVAVTAADVVLVSGASGGVGALAVQLARHRDAQVIGVAGERNHEWLRSRGVVPVSYGPGVEDRITAAAAQLGAPIDAVLDLSGGGYVDLGIRLGVEPARIDTIVDREAAQRHGAKTDGGQAASTPEVAELVSLLAAGAIELPIHATFALAAVTEAYTELEHGHPRGKIVLIP